MQLKIFLDNYIIGQQNLLLGKLLFLNHLK